MPITTDQMSEFADEAQNTPATVDMVTEPLVDAPTRLGRSFAAINARCADPVIAAKLRGLMRGYEAIYGDGPHMQVLDIESVAKSDLYNPDSQRTSRSFVTAGVIDSRLLNAQDHLVIMDHKTTSDDIEDPMSSYWKQLVIEGQASHYLLMEFLNGRRVEYALWDVVKKPGISPREISKKEQTEIALTGQYFGFTLTQEQVDHALRLKRESPELYEYRLAQDCTDERPSRYFQRRRVPRLDSELGEYAQELWEHSQEILAARRNKRWMRNSGACMLYGSPCRFLNICSGHDEPDSDKWRKKEWVHNELPIFGQGAGRDVLTNSRIRCFQTCRRKHYYEYELGIERNEDEDKEALIFGTLWHHAQAAWWGALKSTGETSL